MLLKRAKTCRLFFLETIGSNDLFYSNWKQLLFIMTININIIIIIIIIKQLLLGASPENWSKCRTTLKITSI